MMYTDKENLPVTKYKNQSSKYPRDCLQLPNKTQICQMPIPAASFINKPPKEKNQFWLKFVPDIIMIKLKTSYIIILLLFLLGNNIFYMLENNINHILKFYFTI